MSIVTNTMLWPEGPKDEERALAARHCRRYGRTPNEVVELLQMLGLSAEDLKRPLPECTSRSEIFILAVRRDDRRLESREGRNRERTVTYRPH